MKALVYEKAHSLITAPQAKKAFDIGTEDPRLRDRYGMNSLGQGCLLARRLIESGVRFVTVTDGGWDTHQNNFASLKTRLLPRLDSALAGLLQDLSDRARGSARRTTGRCPARLCRRWKGKIATGVSRAE